MYFQNAIFFNKFITFSKNQQIGELFQKRFATGTAILGGRDHVTAKQVGEHNNVAKHYL